MQGIWVSGGGASPVMAHWTEILLSQPPRVVVALHEDACHNVESTLKRGLRMAQHARCIVQDVAKQLPRENDDSTVP